MCGNAHERAEESEESNQINPGDAVVTEDVEAVFSRARRV